MLQRPPVATSIHVDYAVELNEQQLGLPGDNK
jgi:hypothetical protein